MNQSDQKWLFATLIVGFAVVAAGGLAGCGGTTRTAEHTLAIYDAERRAGPRLTLLDVDRLTIAARLDPTTDQAVVTFRFSPRGAARFRELTAFLARRGRRTHAAQHLAIAVDGRIIFRPYIDFLRFPNGLSGSEGRSSGSDAPVSRISFGVVRVGVLSGNDRDSSLRRSWIHDRCPPGSREGNYHTFKIGRERTELIQELRF